jgi:hypothetical protein
MIMKKMVTLYIVLLFTIISTGQVSEIEDSEILPLAKNYVFADLGFIGIGANIGVN